MLNVGSAATAHILVKLKYDPEKYELKTIETRIKSDQEGMELIVVQIDSTADVENGVPYIAYAPAT